MTMMARTLSIPARIAVGFLKPRLDRRQTPGSSAPMTCTPGPSSTSRTSAGSGSSRRRAAGAAPRPRRTPRACGPARADPGPTTSAPTREHLAHCATDGPQPRGASSPTPDGGGVRQSQLVAALLRHRAARGAPARRGAPAGPQHRAYAAALGRARHALPSTPKQPGPSCATRWSTCGCRGTTPSRCGSVPATSLRCSAATRARARRTSRGSSATTRRPRPPWTGSCSCSSALATRAPSPTPDDVRGDVALCVQVAAHRRGAQHPAQGRLAARVAADGRAAGAQRPSDSGIALSEPSLTR